MPTSSESSWAGDRDREVEHSGGGGLLAEGVGEAEDRLGVLVDNQDDRGGARSFELPDTRSERPQ